VVAAAPPDQPAESVQVVPDEEQLEEYLAGRPDLRQTLTPPTTDEEAHANAALLRELRSGDQARAELTETRTAEAVEAGYGALEGFDPDELNEATNNLILTAGADSPITRQWFEDWAAQDPEGFQDWDQAVRRQLHDWRVAANEQQIQEAQAELARIQREMYQASLKEISRFVQERPEVANEEAAIRIAAMAAAQGEDVFSDPAQVRDKLAALHETVRQIDPEAPPARDPVTRRVTTSAAWAAQQQENQMNALPAT